MKTESLPSAKKVLGVSVAATPYYLLILIVDKT